MARLKLRHVLTRTSPHDVRLDIFLGDDLVYQCWSTAWGAEDIRMAKRGIELAAKKEAA